MSHDCVARVNEQLKTHHTALASVVSLSNGNEGRELIQLTTFKLSNAPRNKKAMTMFASFCPFCGAKL